MILALAGGVGGAKLAQGLAMCCAPADLLVVVNTGDDFVHLGLQISPDLDTVMYWLGGINDRTRGWGVADETWQCIAALERLGGPAWFKLGDRDIATHIERTRLLADGMTLSQVTEHLCARLQIRHRIVPMSDDAVRTIVHTDEGALPFQDYFVRRQCEPRVISIEYDGATAARSSVAFEEALRQNDLGAIIFCPSNPLLSLEPILAVQGVRAGIATHRAPVVAVSPIVGGRAIKGPAAKILNELGREASALEIARRYEGLIDGIIIDNLDAGLKPAIEALGLQVAVTATVMNTLADQALLGQSTLNFAAEIGSRRRLTSGTARGH